MTTTDLWEKVAAKIICDKCSCTECHEIFSTNICPSDFDFSREEVMQFVKTVTDKLHAETNIPFCIDLNTDDIVNIIKETL